MKPSRIPPLVSKNRPDDEILEIMRRPDAPSPSLREVEAMSPEEYDAYYRAEVEAALRELKDPNVTLIPNEVVMAELEAIVRDIELRDEKIRKISA